MSPVWRSLKSILFWSYRRTSWQYDVLCVLILAFVFLTPKSWFQSGELISHQKHQNPSNATEKLLIWPENRRQLPDTTEIERRARIITGRERLRVRGVQEKRDSSGEIIAYEVDIE